MNTVKRINLSEMHPLMREKLEAGAEVVFTITGNSMAPMLSHGRDKVYLVKAESPLKKYDFPLFIREPEGKYITHRVVKVNRDTTYNMLGDNQFKIERGISHHQIIGVAKGFTHNGHYISCDEKPYRLYCHIWWWLYPIRYTILRGKGAVQKIRRCAAAIFKKA
ncbi:MAG: S24/S26 family peptidase [Eubacterium sp.]